MSYQIRRTPPAIVSLLCLTGVCLAQEKSVRPGINDSFRNPKPQEFVERFEIESREVFHQRQRIVDAGQIEPGQTVADIGAGTGLFTRMFSEAVGEKGRVMAVDIAKEFLNHIRETTALMNQQADGASLLRVP